MQKVQLWSHPFCTSTSARACGEGGRAAGAKRIWIDLDCDAFDPAVLPAVQQPLPFGLAPAAFLKLFDAVWSDKVAGMSVSEFDPGRDVRDTGLNCLGWLLEWVLLKVHGE